MPDRGASLLPMPPQEHTKPLRALLRAAGYRPAPRSGTAMAAYGVPAIYSGTLAAPSYGGYGKYGGYGGGYGGYGASSNLIGVENFEHSESGRKAQIIQCREPQVSAADLGLWQLQLAKQRPESAWREAIASRSLLLCLHESSVHGSQCRQRGASCMRGWMCWPHLRLYMCKLTLALPATRPAGCARRFRPVCGGHLLRWHLPVHTVPCHHRQVRKVVGWHAIERCGASFAGGGCRSELA